MIEIAKMHHAHPDPVKTQQLVQKGYVLEASQLALQLGNNHIDMAEQVLEKLKAFLQVKEREREERGEEDGEW